MASLSQAKTLGQIGSILVLLSIIPVAGSVLAIVGLILTLIAVKYISDVLNDSSVFSNILIAIILAIIGVAVGGFVVLGTFLRFVGLRRLAIGGSTTTPTHLGAFIAGIIIGLVVIWIMFILAAYFQRESYNVVAEKLNVSMFRTAAMVYLIGAILVVIGVGFVILFVAQILFVVAFFSMRTELSPPTMVQPAGPSPPAGTTMQTGKFCAKCGASLSSDVVYCPSCGAAQTV